MDSRTGSGRRRNSRGSPLSITLFVAALAGAGCGWFDFEAPTRVGSLAGAAGVDSIGGGHGGSTSGAGGSTGGSAVSAGTAGGGAAGPGTAGGDAGSSGIAGGVAGNAGIGGSAGTAGGAPETDPSRPSCLGLDKTACRGESCCASLLVPGCAGCEFPAGSTGTVVADFRLDKFEVTVARFRNFFDHYSGPPAVNAGAHPLVNSGWLAAWNDQIPALADKSQLVSTANDSTMCSAIGTFTAGRGANEQKPINCIDWYVAFAFCAWDGGFLPTEVEWQYAAAGGTENRTFPWVGNVINSTLALYGYCTHGSSDECQLSNILDVGSKPDGQGKWGQLDLAGSMWEWVLDRPTGTFPPEAPCYNCSDVTFENPVEGRELRGGSWYEDESWQTAAFRLSDPANSAWHNVGIRCARAP